MRAPSTGALLVLSLVLAPAAGAAVWRSAMPEAGEGIGPVAISCPGRSDCVVIGTDSARSIVSGRWDGRGWSFQRISPPPRAGDARLASVSCAGRGSCVAVGTLVARRGAERALAMRLRRGRWSILPGTGTGTPLQAVSCAPHGACFGLGWREVLRWDDRGWSRRPLARRWFPEAVSCWARNRCLAVVEDLTGAGGGGWWTIGVPRSAATATRVLPGMVHDLSSLSCVSGRFCVVAGQDRSLGPLVGAWDGRRWVRQPFPRVYQAYLAGVSCWAVRGCAAVGVDFRDRTVAESWDGRRWRRDLVPSSRSPRYRRGEPAGVSCRAGGACTAVGAGRLGGVLVLRRR